MEEVSLEIKLIRMEHERNIALINMRFYRALAWFLPLATIYVMWSLAISFSCK